MTEIVFRRLQKFWLNIENESDYGFFKLFKTTKQKYKFNLTFTNELNLTFTSHL